MAKDNKLPEVSSGYLPGNNSRRAVIKHLIITLTITYDRADRDPRPQRVVIDCAPVS